MPIISNFGSEVAFKQPSQLGTTIGSEVNVEFLAPPKAAQYGYRYALRICGKHEILIGFLTVSDQDHFVSEVKDILCLIDNYDEKFLLDCLEEENCDYSDHYYDWD
jgi:hypothetical protein